MFSIMRPSLIQSLLTRAVLCGTLVLPVLADAAALGDATVRSSIGQRLEAEIELASLSAAEAESLAVRLAPADAFASAGIDYTALLRSLRFAIERKGDRQVVRLTSDLAVSEPFINLLIELNANGTRTIRQYALLIDPPALDRPAEANPVEVTPAQPAAAVNDASTNDGDTAAAAASRAGPALPDKRVVRKGETLHSIAASVQPEGVQLEQVMVALQNANPAAFVERNANRIRSGSVLKVPEAEAMRAVDPASARRTLRTQTADFLRYQRQLAERSASTAPAAPATQASDAASAGNRSSSGGISVQMNDAKAAPAAQDKLTLSAPGKGDAAISGANTKEALDKVAADKALADANSRIAALEKNIGQMQALLEMQNRGLADAQQRAVQPTPTPAPETKPETKPEPASETESDAKTPAGGNADASAPAAESTAPVQAEAPAARQRAEPAKPPVLAAQPVRQGAAGDWLQDPVARAMAGGGAALLLLGWLLMRSRRVRRADATVADAEPTVAQTVIGESGGRQIDTNHSVFHSNFVPSVSQIDANEVDAVAEADVYIAYGRDEQAEEILLDALRAHPQRHALRVKLLEIYASRKDKQKFGALAAELRLLTHGQGPEWTQVAQLGQLLEPGNHLYGVPSHTTIAPSPVTSSEAANASPVADFELKLEGLLDERRKEQQTAPAAPDPVPSNTIDFQLSGIDDPGSAPKAGAGVGGEIGTAALNTKFELALACREIGDDEGARELLAEVAKARDPELAQRAKSLLQQLA